MSEIRVHIYSIFQQIRSALGEILLLRDQYEEKPDGSYVSKGDLLVQQLIWKYISDNFPRYRLLSEELAPFDETELDPYGAYVILDPIDGTENFISGLREWGVGISIYSGGKHQASGICLPELNDQLVSGDYLRTFKSRIVGLSSSLTKQDLACQPTGYEYRVIGCSMYNMLAAIRGSFERFENVRGGHAWDILPGLNLALEHNCSVYVEDIPYKGELLLPTRKYRVRVSRDEESS